MRSQAKQEIEKDYYYDCNFPADYLFIQQAGGLLFMPDRVKGRWRGNGGSKPQNSILGAAGRLTSGIHDLTFAQLRPLVATTPYRREMWSRFVAFMGWPVMDGKFSHAYLGGGFVSETPRPRDVDLILQTREPYGPEAFHVIERYFRVGLESINAVYGIHLHFWMEGAPPGFADYRVFFQYTKPEAPRDLMRQGLIRINLEDATIKKQLSAMLGGFEISDDQSPREVP